MTWGSLGGRILNGGWVGGCLAHRILAWISHSRIQLNESFTFCFWDCILSSWMCVCGWQLRHRRGADKSINSFGNTIRYWATVFAIRQRRRRERENLRAGKLIKLIIIIFRISLEFHYPIAIKMATNNWMIIFDARRVWLCKLTNTTTTSTTHDRLIRWIF